MNLSGPEAQGAVLTFSPCCLWQGGGITASLLWVLDTTLAQSRAQAQGYSPPLGSGRGLSEQYTSLPQPRKLAQSGAGSLE